MAQNLSPHRARVTTSSFLPSGIGSCQLGQASHCLMAHSSCQDTTVIGSNPGLELQTRKAATGCVELMISTSSPCFLMSKDENYEGDRRSHLSLVILCRKFVHITQQFLAKSRSVGVLHSCGISRRRTLLQAVWLHCSE